MAVVMMLTVLTISILLLRQASEHFVSEVVTKSSCILGVVVDAVDDVVNVDLGVVVAMEAEAAAVEGGGVVEDAGELRKAEGAGDGVAGTTDVVVYSSSIRWRLRSISRRILASSKAATIRLTVVIAVGSSWRGRWRDG